MKNVIIGVIIGVIISTIAFVPILDSQRKEKMELGRGFGFTDGAMAVIEFLDRNFTEKKKSDETVIENFSCKDRSVFIIESESSRTIKTQ